MILRAPLVRLQNRSPEVGETARTCRRSETHPAWSGKSEPPGYVSVVVLPLMTLRAGRRPPAGGSRGGAARTPQRFAVRERCRSVEHE